MTQEGGGNLNYVPSAFWSSLPDPVQVESNSEMVTLTLQQTYPLAFPFVRAIYPSHEVVFSSDEVKMLDHASLYLEN